MHWWQQAKKSTVLEASLAHIHYRRARS